MLRFLFHLFGALQFTFSVYYDLRYVKVPKEILPSRPLFGGKFVYLTFWDAIIQSVFFWICVVNDIIGSNAIPSSSYPNLPLIRRFKDTFFASIAFPLSAFVAVTFWGLYAIDRELVLPKVLDPYFPLWLNHIMHTNILIFTFLELITSFRQYPSKKQGLSILISFMLIYLLWTFVIYGKSGQWVYPVLEVLNWPQRIAFFLALLLLVQVFYFLGSGLNYVIWGSKWEDANSSKKKKKK